MYNHLPLLSEHLNRHRTSSVFLNSTSPTFCTVTIKDIQKGADRFLDPTFNRLLKYNNFGIANATAPVDFIRGEEESAEISNEYHHVKRKTSKVPYAINWPIRLPEPVLSQNKTVPLIFSSPSLFGLSGSFRIKRLLELTSARVYCPHTWPCEPTYCNARANASLKIPAMKRTGPA